MEQPPRRRALLIRNHPHFQTWGLWEAVLDHIREQCFTDPLSAEGLAQLGLTLAETLDAGYYGMERIEDLRARTWGYIGNARRIRFDLHGSEAAFATAHIHLRQGTGDILERALLLDLKASLRRAQRRFADAERLMHRVLRIYHAVGETHRAGRILVGMSALYEYMGTPERAIPRLHEALKLIDAEREPRLLWSAHHNLIATLAELGRFMEAQGLFIQARRLYDRFPDGFTQNRRHWVAGRIARGLGQTQKAETHLQTAQIGFLAEGATYDTALVSLELAALFAEQGRTRELKEIAEEMLTIFASRQIHREALAAFSFLHQAAAAERASVEVVTRVAAHFKRLRYNPETIFQQPE
jgi:tetratricopeptide (TPR) repeat protein